MKTMLTVSGRGVVIEIYTETRQQEFDAEEKELAAAMQKKQKPQPPNRRKRRS